MNLNIYYFINEFNKNEIEKLSSKISLIYRNYDNKCDFSELKKLVLYCKNKRRKVYISNNLKAAIKYNFDGLYIPSFNKKLGFRNIVKNNFEILGSAHNVNELKTKEKQGSGNSYPDTDTSGHMVAIGYQHETDAGIGIRAEIQGHVFDDVSVTNGVATTGNHNKITVSDMIGATAQLSLVKTF
mgnify:CR=1 FL=1